MTLKTELIQECITGIKKAVAGGAFEPATLNTLVELTQSEMDAHYKAQADAARAETAAAQQALEELTKRHDALALEFAEYKRKHEIGG